MWLVTQLGIFIRLNFYVVVFFLFISHTHVCVSVCVCFQERLLACLKGSRCLVNSSLSE